MSDGNLDLAAEHRALAQAMDLETFSPAQPDLFQNDVMWAYFERLRKEDPVHFTPESDHGPYWSITKYNDIMTVDTNHEVFSSEGGITIFDQIGGEGPGGIPRRIDRRRLFGADRSDPDRTRQACSQGSGQEKRHAGRAGGDHENLLRASSGDGFGGRLPAAPARPQFTIRAP
jgi:cytochrome P450